jgi:signal transduction histidine kinase
MRAVVMRSQRRSVDRTQWRSYFANNGTVTTYDRKRSTQSSVRSLYESSDGAIWLGTELGGVVRMTAASLQTTVLDSDVPDNTIRAFAEQPGRGVWAGSNGGRLTLFAGGEPVRRLEYEGGRRFFVRAMAVDKSGSLWIATDGNGLAHIADATTRNHTRRDGLSSNSLRSLYIDAEGTVWIGTDGGGLNRLKDGKITVYDTRSGLFDDRILQILEGEDGRLWMSSNNGIFAVEKRALHAFAEHRIDRLQSLFIDDREGMRTRDCSGGSQPAGAKKHDGTLWFPTDGGVAIVDPRRVQKNAHLPPVQIERVTAERTPVHGTTDFELPKGTRNLEIAYTALSFAVPERVRFRYRLEGYDEAWIDAERAARRITRHCVRGIIDSSSLPRTMTASGIRAARPSRSRCRRISTRGAPSRFVFALIAAAIWLAVTSRIRSIRREAARNAEMERRLVVIQKMDALGHLASGIAHDFNNTLMAAYPWAELIQRDYPDDPKLQGAAQHIVQAVERAKKVTSQLLDFAQPKQPEVTPFDLGELAQEQVSMARALLPPESQIHLSVNPSIGATGDRAKIGQVLLNLLLNASDAMPNGGSISVDVREPVAEEAESWNVAPGEMVLLSVSDTGTGIEPDVIPRIFDPFYTTKGVGKGTGLGLAVVHRILQDHHGTVQLESQPGKGTTVHVLLPKGEIPAGKPEPFVAPSAKSTVRGRTVLLIDDEAVTIEVSRTLHAEGAVHTATAGRTPANSPPASARRRHPTSAS